ncbi:CHAD domain-containing protein [Spartinivicinus poritis]|uniref:CHAD domain-containing protein n=1 Tax=Spartinivicinus poritis TaxID=2994640 RepID=A0ABT5U2F2_9GAMM|nr:CHAD domain-containing protein [Spartinivicinus sp. A2-2]MDE1460472.1 CHAD domain-containing protein [Spartinivicinus sp. A2-2]
MTLLAQSLAKPVVSYWQLPSRKNPQSAVRLIKKQFPNVCHSQTTQSISLYDAFGWPLWFDNTMLYQSDSQLILAPKGCFAYESLIASCTVNNLNGHSQPLEISQLPSGILKNKVKPLVKLRALQQMATLTCDSHTIKMINSDQKMVCKAIIYILSDQRNSTTNIEYLELQPLRGFNEEAQQFTQFLEQHFTTIAEPPLIDYWDKNKFTPQPYSIKPHFTIQPETPTREVVLNMVNTMLALAQQNEQGVINDIDTEYLHDYRVAIRKIRSLLSLIRQVFPKTETKQLKQQLKELAQKTNLLRDLDVYLLAKDELKAQLPIQLQPGLDKLFQTFADLRKTECKSIVQHLQSKTYQDTLTTIKNILKACKKAAKTKNSHKPITKIATQEIHNKYQLICHNGSLLTATTDDEAFHDLRLECKKLRYLLELFADLMDTTTNKQAVSSLKKLQDKLGHFNDLSVQQEKLLSYLDGNNIDSLEAAAIGGLVSVMRRQQTSLKAEIISQLNDFCSFPTHNKFNQLFQKVSQQ